MEGGLDTSALAAEAAGLLRYARTIVRDPTAAEDLVQETFVRALEKQHAFRGDSSTATWLHRILHNLAVDASRRHREDPTEDVVALVEERWQDNDYTVDAAMVAVRAETVEDLKDALLRLPMTYRTSVVLHDMEGLTVPEIARVEGISLAAAKQRLRRGRMLLVSALAAGAERREALRGVPLSCWEARVKVSDYLDDHLPAEQRAMVEAHLATCPNCPPLYAALVGTRDALGRLRDADTVVPEPLARRIAEVVSGLR